jgi:REP element-mobilizing transposase RayT
MSDIEFNADEPLGYLITWTSYGTWLPGDQRGWRRKQQPDIQLPNALSRESAECKMTEPEFRLTKADRSIVEATITKHCNIRSWTLHTVNARSNHVHVVLTAPGYTPEVVRDQLKAWCTRNLKPNLPSRTKFWTEGASRQYLNTEDELEAAIIYVKEAQDRKGVEYE